MQHHPPDKGTTKSEVESTTPALLRLPLVIRVTGLGRSTIYKLISEKKFPGPVRVSERRVAWRRADIDRWSEDRPPATH